MKDNETKQRSEAGQENAGGTVPAPSKVADEPHAPSDDPARRGTDEALARAQRAEERLARAEQRLEWLESRNVEDECTGLLNRRGFRDGMRRGLARARRYGETGALLLLDLIRYEAIVEEHGSSAGAYTLVAIANILRTRFREVDYVARLERGRFAVQMVLIGQEDARRRAATLKGYLDDLEVPWQGGNIPIQVRIGLVHYGQNDATEDLLERAEAELEERERSLARLRHTAE